MPSPGILVECGALRTVRRAKRPDGTLNFTTQVLMVGALSAPSGRFARGTVTLACYFLCTAGEKASLEP